MTEQTRTSASNQIRVRVGSRPEPTSLERVINATLDEEYAKGAEVVDIKLSSTAIANTSGTTPPREEYVALILLRLGHTTLSPH
jgi:hypothetical protein